jgi:hypothetical protein
MFDHYYHPKRDDLSWIDDMHQRLLDRGIDAISIYKNDLLNQYRCSCCGEDFIHSDEGESEVNIPQETFFCCQDCKTEYNS